jgi:hypothetical protein
MATNFLYAAGTDGFIATPFNLQTTELNTLGSGNTVISSVGGTSGVFTQTNTAAAIWGVVSFLAGGSFTPTGSPYLAGWFIVKADDSHFEKLVSNTAPPRVPDFIIPLYASAYAANDISAAQGPQGTLVQLPTCAFEVLIQNNSGVSLPSSSNKVILGPVAVQY